MTYTHCRPNKDRGEGSGEKKIKRRRGGRWKNEGKGVFVKSERRESDYNMKKSMEMKNKVKRDS
jgi:hypothetical protein